MSKVRDVTGQVFTHLTVLRLSRVAPYGKRRRNSAYWWCRCVCGRELEIPAPQLLYGYSKSCGCLKWQMVGAANRTHGLTGTAEHRVWRAMQTRCENPKAINFKNYGGRGIKVCERWKDFESFLADMGLRPSTRHSIERRDNNGKYEPSNCYWATRKEQSVNQQKSVYIEYNGERLSALEWSERTGMNVRAIRWRKRQGWTPGQILTTPLTLGNRIGPRHAATN